MIFRVAAPRLPWDERNQFLFYPEGVALWTRTAMCVAIAAWLNLYQISLFTSSSQPKNGAPFLVTQPGGPQCTAIWARSPRAWIAQ